MKFSLFKGEKGESDSIVTTKDGKSLKKQKNGDKKLVLLIENTQSKNIPCQRRPRKRALLIGINYFMTENELRGI